MRSRRADIVVALCLGLLAGLAYPAIDVAMACRIPDSEACVWGKAYFPLTLGLSLVLLGGVTAGAVYAALSWWRRSAR